MITKLELSPNGQVTPILAPNRDAAGSPGLFWGHLTSHSALLKHHFPMGDCLHPTSPVPAISPNNSALIWMNKTIMQMLFKLKQKSSTLLSSPLPSKGTGWVGKDLSVFSELVYTHKNVDMHLVARVIIIPNPSSALPFINLPLSKRTSGSWQGSPG